MPKKKKNTEKFEIKPNEIEKFDLKPAKIAKSTPTVKGVNVVDELKKFRTRAKDDKLKAKIDEVHDILMGVKPGPITIKPSSGWLSYLSGKIRFAALEVRKSFIRIHSLELNDGKMICQIIKVTADDKIPVQKIRLRAEGFITDKLKIAKAKE